MSRDLSAAPMTAERGYRVSAPRFGDYRDPVGPVQGVLVGVACGLVLWGLIFGFALLVGAL